MSCAGWESSINRQNTAKSSNLTYLDTKFNALEANIPYNSKVVSAELYQKFNYQDNFFKNQILDQILKQIYLSEVMGNIQYSFSMNQLEKLEEVHLNRMSKYNRDVKDRY